MQSSKNVWGGGKAPQAGASAGWRLVDGCFGRGVYARMRRMKTEALKGQIWQVPYLVAELLKCYERERVCYPKFRKALKGQTPGGVWRIDVLGEVFRGGIL